MPGRLVVDDHRGRRGTGRAVVAEEECRGLSRRSGTVRAIAGPGRDLGALRRVVDEIDPLARAPLIGRRANLRVAAEEGVAGLACRGEVAAVPRERAGRGDRALAGRVVRRGLRWRRPRSGHVDRVVRGERPDGARRSERRAAVRRLRDLDRIEVVLLCHERPPCHVDVAVPRDRDVRELDVARARELLR